MEDQPPSPSRQATEVSEPSQAARGRLALMQRARAMTSFCGRHPRLQRKGHGSVPLPATEVSPAEHDSAWQMRLLGVLAAGLAAAARLGSSPDLRALRGSSPSFVSSLHKYRFYETYLRNRLAAILRALLPLEVGHWRQLLDFGAGLRPTAVPAKAVFVFGDREKASGPSSSMPASPIQFHAPSHGSSCSMSGSFGCSGHMCAPESVESKSGHGEAGHLHGLQPAIRRGQSRVHAALVLPNLLL